VTKPIVTVRNFANAPKIPCSVPKKVKVSRLYGSVQCSIQCCAETGSIVLTAVTGADGLPHLQ